MRVVLSVAGSDPIGGAGVQADLKAIASMDQHGVSVITTITAQNTSSVMKVRPIGSADILAQLNAVTEDADIAAIKTGMIYSPEIARTVAKGIRGIEAPLVIDPVLMAGVGGKLSSAGLINEMRSSLIPLATVITPNRQEAEVLSSMTIDNMKEAEKACRAIAELGPKAVLLKGGHFDGAEAVDLLYDNGKTYEFSAPRSPNKVHGTGCTMASFLACNLANGKGIKEASLDAKRRITEAIMMAYPVGKGVMVVNPMASKQKDAMRYDIVQSLRSEVKRLERELPDDLIPDVGCNLVHSLPAPQGFNDVCGVAGRVVSCEGRAKAVGDVSFGASRNMARLIMIMNRMDPRVRAGMNLRFVKDRLRAFGAAGGSVLELNIKLDLDSTPDLNGLLLDRIGQTGFVPDMISDHGAIGKEAMLYLLGRDPEDVLRKLRTILS